METKMKKPVIGINLDFEEKGGGYIIRPYHALSEKYFSSIYNHGGTPIAFPSSNLDVDAILDLVDGILMIGGNDYDPALFGEQEAPDLNLKIMHQRSKFDFLLAKKALERDLPVLGICAGMQMINCLHGGDLFLDITKQRPNSLHHQGTQEELSSFAHSLAIVPGTRLSQILEERDTIEVNSRHHQALKKIGKDVVVAATAPDGIVEAIEIPSHKFCIGVEWHPEYELSDADTLLFKAFINACRS